MPRHADRYIKASLRFTVILALISINVVLTSGTGALKAADNAIVQLAPLAFPEHASQPLWDFVLWDDARRGRRRPEVPSALRHRGRYGSIHSGLIASAHALNVQVVLEQALATPAAVHNSPLALVEDVIPGPIAAGSTRGRIGH